MMAIHAFCPIEHGSNASPSSQTPQASQQVPDVQVGRTGMDTGAEGEVLSLLDLPTAVPDLWQLMTERGNNAKHVSNGVTQSKPKLGSPSEAAITSDGRVPVLTA